jgi:hypothetical protein
MGYDIKRFIGGKVNEEFVCVICQDVLEEPVMVSICEHIFCDGCIRGWILEKKECPVDRKVISESHLRDPFRAFKNLLNQLEITCDYSALGCNKQLKLENLKIHTKECEFDPEKHIIKCERNQEIKKMQYKEHEQNCLPLVKRNLEMTKKQLTSISAYIADFIINNKVDSSEGLKSNMQLIRELLNTDGLDVKGENGPIDQMLIFLSWLHSNKINSHLIWDNIFDATFENSYNCSRFLELKGMNYLVMCFNAFPDDSELSSRMINVVNNFIFNDQPLQKLMIKEYIEFFVEMTHSDIFLICFHSISILSYIVADCQDLWSQKLPEIALQSVLTKIKYAINKWKLNTKSNLYYSSFDKIFQVLRSKNSFPELQFRCLWCLAYATRKDCCQYIPLIEKENGIHVLEKLKNERTTKDYVLKMIELVLFQYKKYKKFGNLGGIEDSDEMDVKKLK